MIPTIGRNVIAKNLPSNGADEHPAVITRVWSHGVDPRNSPVCVNLCVFADAAGTLARTSVMLYDNREQADRFLATQPQRPGPVVCFWPDIGEPKPPVAAIAMAA